MEKILGCNLNDRRISQARIWGINCPKEGKLCDRKGMWMTPEK